MDAVPEHYYKFLSDNGFVGHKDKSPEKGVMVYTHPDPRIQVRRIQYFPTPELTREDFKAFASSVLAELREL